MSAGLPSLERFDVSGRVVLVRSDLNVPTENGRITDRTRITRLLPTLRELSGRGAKVVILSHFDRPGGKFVPSMTLAPLVDALAAELEAEVRFGVDCVGDPAREAVSQCTPGGYVLLENLRFHAGEEAGDENFARALAELGDFYVNDAFSCSHRAHASITGLPRLLPAAAGRLMAEEVAALDGIFSAPERPLCAVIGGSKISTKLELLGNLIARMDVIVIGGAMANTFLLAQGHDVGKSICERDMAKTAASILAQAGERGCRIVLPSDLIVTEKFAPHAPCRVVPVGGIPSTHTATDIGPESVERISQVLRECRMIVWNGPVGAFETSPFDASTVSLARMLASLTHQGRARTIAGGGDTVAAIAHAGLTEAFTYLSTAGGAFLEWLEGKQLPGVSALQAAA